MPTLRHFKLDSTKRPKVLVAKNGKELHRCVVMKLQELLLKNPDFKCHDSTHELDVGREAHAQICLNGEVVRVWVVTKIGFKGWNPMEVHHIHCLESS